MSPASTGARGRDQRPRGERNRTFLAGAIIAVLVFISYANTLSAPFVLDDANSIVSNASIRNLGAIGTVLTPASNLATGRRPVLNLSFALN